jgi:hypothetical protein
MTPPDQRLSSIRRLSRISAVRWGDLRDFVNLLTQAVAMQIRDMARDQSGGSSRESIR